jgi:hypothetical protein
MTADIKKPPRLKPWRVTLEVAESATSSLRNNHLAQTAGWRGVSPLLMNKVNATSIFQYDNKDKLRIKHHPYPSKNQRIETADGS